MLLCDSLGDDCYEFPPLLCFVLNFVSFCDVGVVGFCGGWSRCYLFIFKAWKKIPGKVCADACS